ncbi:MAG: T9SS type A sorting domain-containing protein [Saprospiraceae bacterium]|nr:T9SS type A sorting domain-containing protein [Saprospiraceae bacterium]
MKKLYPLSFLLILLPLLTIGQTRYLDEVFTDVSVETGITYGVNATVLYYSLFGQAVPEALKMDIYTPDGDTEVDRPLILYFHTGNFLPFRNPANPSELGFNGSCGGERSDSAAVEMCTRLAKMGYVVASVDYRLGWNPLAATDVLRRYGIINAAYRGVQDARTAVRYFRKADGLDPNQYGIDPDKIVVWGQGTGGYLSLTMPTLDNYLKIPLASNGKFVYDHDNNPGTPPIPMILEGINGDIYGETVGINPTDGDTLCYPNHVGLSSEYALGVNLGGASADSAWVDPGQVPLISFAVPTDNFAPYAEGIVNVPGTNLQVIVTQGSYIIQQLHEAFGNQDAMLNAGITFDLTAEQEAAFAASPPGLQDVKVGLYPFNQPDKANAPGIPVSVAPWEWTSFAGVNPADPCNMDGGSARMYIDTIVRFYAPRACFVLGLDDCISTLTGLDIVPGGEVGLNAYPNPSSDYIVLTSDASHPMQEINLYDEMGRLIKVIPSVNQSTYTLERGQIQPGRYVALIRFDQGTAVRKLIFN